MERIEIKNRLFHLLAINNEKPIDMSNKVGIPKSSLSLYLNGKREPRQDVITKIAIKYDVSEAWLMGYNVPMERKINVEAGKTDFDLIDKIRKLSEEDRKSVEDMVDFLLSKKSGD